MKQTTTLIAILIGLGACDEDGTRPFNGNESESGGDDTNPTTGETAEDTGPITPIPIGPGTPYGDFYWADRNGTRMSQGESFPVVIDSNGISWSIQPRGRDTTPSEFPVQYTTSGCSGVGFTNATYYAKQALRLRGNDYYLPATPVSRSTQSIQSVWNPDSTGSTQGKCTDYGSSITFTDLVSLEDLVEITYSPPPSGFQPPFYRVAQ